MNFESVMSEYPSSNRSVFLYDLAGICCGEEGKGFSGEERRPFQEVYTEMRAVAKRAVQKISESNAFFAEVTSCGFSGR